MSWQSIVSELQNSKEFKSNNFEAEQRHKKNDIAHNLNSQHHILDLGLGFALFLRVVESRDWRRVNKAELCRIQSEQDSFIDDVSGVLGVDLHEVVNLLLFDDGDALVEYEDIWGFILIFDSNFEGVAFVLFDELILIVFGLLQIALSRLTIQGLNRVTLNTEAVIETNVTVGHRTRYACAGGWIKISASRTNPCF